MFVTNKKVCFYFFLTRFWVSNQVEDASWFVVDVEAQSVFSSRQPDHEVRISVHCERIVKDHVKIRNGQTQRAFAISSFMCASHKITAGKEK